MDDGKITVAFEIDADLLVQVTEVLKPYGLTPEDAVVQFFEFLVAAETRDYAVERLKQWIENLDFLEDE